MHARSGHRPPEHTRWCKGFEAWWVDSGDG